jgi:N-acetyl-anhydromuramyl-L-alanine amidase AmpD
LCKVLPRITCDYPRDEAGRLVLRKLPDDQLKEYHGVLGHFHIQTNKTDPGPAFQWDYVLGHARNLMHHGMSELADQASQGHLRPRD